MAIYTQLNLPQSYGGVDAVGSGVVIPDAQLMFTADFSRAGHDLVLTGSQGAKFTVTGYFNTDTPPSLISPDGAKLPGDVVMSLAGPQFPGQYAQAGNAASGKEAIGKVESSSGSASAVRTDGTTVILKAGDPVFQGDVVMTGPGSKLGISFVDGTIFSLTDNARMVLNSLIYDPDGGKSNSMLFSLVEGSFVFAAGQIAPTGDMKIQTPVATMGIRGTAPTVNINSYTGEVNFSIIADPDDGNVGTYTLYNIDTGLPIGTVSSVGTKWQLKSADGQAVELDKTDTDLLNDANAVGQINTIYSQWQSSTQQNTDGPQAGPQNSNPPSSGLNTNPQNPDAPGGEGIGGNTGGQGEGEGQNNPPDDPQQSATPPPPPNTDNDPPPNPINTVPDITGDTSGDVTEDETLTTTGELNVADPDAGESGTQTQNNTAGTYGSFSVNAAGNWTYVLDNTNADVQGLFAGQTLTETFDVTSIDGSATETVTVTINGAPGDTIITGDDNTNVLNGTAGDNIINALGGKDFIFASAGNDIIDGGAGFDTVSYASTSQGVIVNLVDGTVNGAEIGFDTFVRLENFVAGSGNDRVIVGEDGPIFFDGGGGIDTIEFFGDLNIDTATTEIDAENTEIVDLNKTHNNTFTISADDVRNDDGESILQIRGGEGDTVNLPNEFNSDDDYDDDYGDGYGYRWQLAENSPIEIDGLLFDVFEFVDSEGTLFTSVHIEQGIQVNLPGATSLFESFENGFVPNEWATINATISSENSTEGNFSAHLSTTTGHENNNDFGEEISQFAVEIPQENTPAGQNILAIAELVNVDVETLNSLAGTPESEGFATEGSAIGTRFYGEAGQVLSFDWFFSTYENLEDDNGITNDFAFVVVNGKIFKLFDAEAAGNQTDNIATEGWNSFSILLEQSGYHDIAFGVLDNEDNEVETALDIDNIQLGSSLSDQLLLEGGPGNDILIGSGNRTTLTGNEGADKFVFGNFGYGADLITDFGSQDTLDLSGLLNDVFDPANDDIEDFVRATTHTLTGETTVAVDIDGADGPAGFSNIAILQGIGADFGIKVSIGDEDTSVTSAAIAV